MQLWQLQGLTTACRVRLCGAKAELCALRHATSHAMLQAHLMAEAGPQAKA